MGVMCKWTCERENNLQVTVTFKKEADMRRKCFVGVYRFQELRTTRHKQRDAGPNLEESMRGGQNFVQGLVKKRKQKPERKIKGEISITGAIGTTAY